MVTVTSSVVSGSAEKIALTVSGLPAGVTGSFDASTICRWQRDADALGRLIRGGRRQLHRQRPGGGGDP